MIQIIIGIIIFLIVILAFFVISLLYGNPFGSLNAKQKKNAMRSMMSVNRHQKISQVEQKENKLDQIIKNSKKKKLASSKLTLEKKIRYAQWKIPPIAFYLLQFLISSVIVFITSRFFDLPIVVASLFSGPILMNGLIGFFIDRRYKKFDKDYPSFLLNIVSMLKTGMNTISAIEAAAAGLDPDSLVKEEVRLMVERLRFGVSEDKSIGSFGEDIFHPEIELFVQALILSRQVGGQLSDTLDRLSRQVRKRQHFRESASAAVGLQRGSIWVIIGIMIGLEGYIYVTSPDLITSSLEDETGWMVWQSAILMIFFGIYWLRQVTKLKI